MPHGGGSDLCRTWDNSMEHETDIVTETDVNEEESLLPTDDLAFSNGTRQDPWGRIDSQPEIKTFVLKKKTAGQTGYSLSSCMKFRIGEFDSAAGRIRKHYSIPDPVPFSVEYSVKRVSNNSEMKFNIEVPQNNAKFTASDKRRVAEMFETLYCQVEPMSVLAVKVPETSKDKKRSKRFLGEQKER